MRYLTPLEIETSRDILARADLQACEFAAFLESPNGPLIAVLTSNRPDGVDPSEDIVTHAKQGGNIVVHHNHLSQESLSDADWNGLVELFSEMFAHCADGTVYWGRARDKVAVAKALAAMDALEIQAMDALFRLIMDADRNSSYIAQFFRKEVLNRAMRIRGMVEYECCWGSKVLPPLGAHAFSRPANDWGKRFTDEIDIAAEQLAGTL